MKSANRQRTVPATRSFLEPPAAIRAAMVLISLAANVCALPAAAQVGTRADAVLTDKDAFVLLPAELISGPVVMQSSLSPAGRNVAVLRKSARFSAENVPSAAHPNPPPPREEHEILFWNAGIRRPVSLWQSAQPRTNVSLSAWMPETESLFAVVDRVIPRDVSQPNQFPEHEWKVLLLGLGIERAVQVPTPTGRFSRVNVEVSPLKRLAILQLVSDGSEHTELLYLLHPNGRVGVQVAAPASGNYSIAWDLTGNPILVRLQTRGATAETRLSSIDPRTGRTDVLEKSPQMAEVRRDQASIVPFHAVVQRHDLAAGNTTQRISPIWLEWASKGESSRALLTPNGADVRLLPDSIGALYNAHNALWFTPLLQMNKGEYLAMRQAAERAAALSSAKQLGLAAIMFANDNDDVLPGPDGIEAKLAPYLLNDSLFDGFAYTYLGGSLADIVSPSQTVLGHISGPGGRALLYADGHAKWVNN